MLPDKETRDIQAYLDDTLPPLRREKFELRLKNDPDFKARFDEMKPILETIEDIQLENDIKEIIERLEVEVEPGIVNEPVRKLRPDYFSIFRYASAACVIALIGFTTYEIKHESDIALSLAAEKFEQESYATKGDVGNGCPDDKTLEIFYSGKYDSFLKTIQKQPESTCTAYFKGMSFMALNNTNEAIAMFKKAKESTSIDEMYYKHSAEWNLCLAFLKNNEKREAIEMLNNILKTPDHQFGIQAGDLLKTLKKELIFYNLRF